ncbi:MAG: S-formylglutathione hydrolase [Burkholderiaceae bacterium]
MAQLELLGEHGCFGGRQFFYRHSSKEIGLPMRFALFIPPRASGAGLPMLMFLAGLTCTEETFTMKAGAQRMAAQLGIALLMPDTSPRGAGVPGEAESWDFGAGASFYLDATREPWAKHWRMESYLMNELLPVAVGAFSIDVSRIGVFGHSMGGHGALTLALRHRDRFASVSAFAPIAAPMQAPWGRKALSGYFGDDVDRWERHDASVLMSRQLTAPFPAGLLIDQGLADPFLSEQLYPSTFEAVCQKVGQPLQLRYHEGYDHGYYFISSFVDDHLRFHHAALKSAS